MKKPTETQRLVAIQRVIIDRTRQMMQDYQIPNNWHINNGFCDDLAYPVAENLEQQGIALRVLHNGDLFSTSKDNNILRETLKNLPFEHFKSVWQDNVGTHWWLYDEQTGLHFDAEAPQGKADMMDLPIFERAISTFYLDNIQTQLPPTWQNERMQQVVYGTLKALAENFEDRPFKKWPDFMQKATRDIVKDLETLMPRDCPLVKKVKKASRSKVIKSFSIDY